METVNLGQRPGVNVELLDAEIREAFPGAVYGVSYAKGNLFAHFKDGTGVEEQRAAIEAVVDAHDPAALTPEQAKKQQRQAAAQELEASDFDTWLAGVNSATTIADIKLRMRQLGRVVWLVAKAQGLTDADEPGGGA